MNIKKTLAFTVLELVAVVAIIVVLAAIGIPAYNSWRNRSKIEKARATIAQIEMALEMYKTDYGVYPLEGEEMNNPSNPKIKVYLNNYMKFNSEDMGSGNPPVRDPNGNMLLDPWGRYYVVLVDHDGDGARDVENFWHNRNSSYIYSYGPDKIEGRPNYDSVGNADNIDNYKQK